MIKLYKLRTIAVSDSKKMRYPQFGVYEICKSYHESFEEAHEQMMENINKFKDKRLYCFFIQEYWTGLDYEYYAVHHSRVKKLKKSTMK